MAKAKRLKTKSTSKSKLESKAEIDLVGGSYDGKKFGVVFPTPKYIVLGLGRELYLRQDPDIVIDATYRYTDDWATYKEWVKEQAQIK